MDMPLIVQHCSAGVEIQDAQDLRGLVLNQHILHVTAARFHGQREAGMLSAQG